MTDPFARPDPHQLQRKWGWFLAFGLFALVAGTLAFANLMVATAASVFYLGALMLVAGLMHLVHAFQVKAWQDWLFWAVSGALYTLAGFLAFTNPGLTAAVFTLIMAIALIIAGLVRLWAGNRLRPMPGAGWVMVGGAITALAGLVIATGWPVNSVWVLGLFLAIDLIFQGWALVAVALAARRMG
ncbi:HdeD family acid-resistance protein [Rhizobium sp. SSA_523]|uniref:HdeD family acid-resistance protein n=1 Tax=Rhizobium sp. SSA_523 TaxID=2952477 RepID=UPI002090C49E|nr:HdeD family acid-resistance protein [Rhizobium sp. SSA_523]MCO5730983.1 HdeD family acid-resistance protein [Rhizobium sp. SSA_523]WKC24210.1 HdeD family acid-resistance protein [Rhizobium sp. SSA_523]